MLIQSPLEAGTMSSHSCSRFAWMFLLLTCIAFLFEGPNPLPAEELRCRFQQLTNTLDETSKTANLSADGRHVAYSIDGRGAYLLDLTTSVERVIETEGVIRSIDRDGSTILLGSNSVTGDLAELTWIDTRRNTKWVIDRTCDEILGCFASSPGQLDYSGTRALVVSRGNLASGLNPNGTRELFLYDHLSESFFQITETSPIQDISPVAQLSGDAEWIAFIANYSPLDGNLLPENQLFFYDTVSKEFSQLTNETSQLSYPVLSADGQRLVLLILLCQTI